VTLPETQTVSFACTCSREGTAQALVSIGQAECEDILAEQGSIRLNCQFCHSEYVFELTEIRQLFAVQVH
jgi:molecular chaperone Hsp33